MRSYVDMTGLDVLRSRVSDIQNPDFTPLMKRLMRIIEEDNRKGVLAGLDKDGMPMERVTYRPKGGKAAKPTDAQRNTDNPRKRKGSFSGFGPAASGWNNNLTSAEYRRLGGPALAPRGAFSRVITNLRTAFEKVSSHVWDAYGAWYEVVDQRGRPFLGHHFDGDGGLPRRDLRGVRPEGRAKAREATVAWMADQIRWVATGDRRAG
jgi:hypothetical protein